MIEPDYKHVLFKDLRGYIRKLDYLSGFTATEQEFIRKNIGAVGESDLDRINTVPVSVTYDELSKLIARKELIPGSVYTITNFLSIYSSNRKNSSGQYITYGKDVNPSSIYTLITIAATTEKLFSTIAIISNDENSIKWIALYNVNKETLPDGVTTMGRIYYLRDHNLNQASYDFKNVRTYMNGKDYYTFSDSNGNDNSENCFNNNLTISKNNIFIGNCNNNTIYGSCNWFSNPVSNLVGRGTGLKFDKDGLDDETVKHTIKYNDKYYIDYLDLETLTHLFYELANNSGISL